MLFNDKTIAWLLKGEVSIQYQVYKDLLESETSYLNMLQRKIETEGWGAQFLAVQNPNSHWGRGYYQPKWTSTHYTLLDLKNLGLPQDNIKVRKIINMLLDQSVFKDGGINYSKTVKISDVCITGMVVNFASYFQYIDKRVNGLIDYLLSVQLPDGGWNCEHHRGATHSSLHTTISVLEGLLEYRKAGAIYKLEEIKVAENKGQEFILEHKLFQSHRTGKTIDAKMLMLSYPYRWRYDILRALDYFQFTNMKYDNRMDAAIEILLKKQRKDGTWPLQRKHPGQVHFDMEQTGKPSRWNTLRALRVLNKFDLDFVTPSSNRGFAAP